MNSENDLTDTDRQRIIDKADIRELKLTSGETILGEMYGQHDDKVILHEPYCVVFNSSGLAMFRRWFVSVNGMLKYIPRSYIITETVACDLVKKQYIKAVLEDHAMDAMEQDPDNYEFYADMDNDKETIH